MLYVIAANPQIQPQQKVVNTENTIITVVCVLGTPVPATVVVDTY